MNKSIGHILNKNKKTVKAFTIIELLVVIVIIGILAAITIVSYSGIVNKAITASIKNDLSNNLNLLKMYQVDHGYYPSSLDFNHCPSAPDVDTRYCLKVMSGAVLSYSGGGQAFTLTDTHTSTNISYKINENSSMIAVIPCPAGFIPVPGSATYGTSDFCIMKYEAKADENGDGVGDNIYDTGAKTWPTNSAPISASRKLVSSANGYPVAKISQNLAMSFASTDGYVHGCASGCHLVSDAEWLTVAQNVLSVASNWSGGSVGNGYIFSGHNDNSPMNGLVADTDDSNGYYGTGNILPSNQRRTLTLTNGEVIWDFAGNLYEWTSGQTTSQPTSMASWAWYNWGVISGGIFPSNPYPVGTSISGAGGWTSANGIGMVFGLSNNVTQVGFLRGGDWSNGNGSGVMSLGLYWSPTYTDINMGFRVAH